MTYSEYQTLLAQRAPEFTLTGDNDVVVTRLGLSITLFFKQGYTPEKRHRILACFRRFRDEFGSHLRFHTHEFKGMKKYSPENIAKVETAILEKGIYDQSGWEISDARNMYEAPDCLISYLDTREAQNKNENSYLSLVLPRDYLKNQAGMARFNDWLTFLCQQLEPDSGDCGYCLLLPQDYDDYCPAEYELAKRYPSLQVNANAFTAKRQYNNSTRGVNWITILHHRHIKRLGGEAWVRQILSRDPAITTENYPAGLLIRAGQFPDLTPAVEGLSPHYLAVNQLIRPIRVVPQEGHSLHFYGVNQFDEQSTIAWYARYDQGPLQVSPLKSDTPALVSGYWKTGAGSGTLRFIAQGEMAPRASDGKELWWELDHEAEDFRNTQG
ncbi:type VI immunity family protein [Entomohabitans teleogrylli]|uniref:type VI immunity family protein n=1 Tax=Entomohabitans teleogrylli TaxID=1384589 RepID=UPI00073DA2CA|nr:type VI immunity family protein [Entomohabitans teleogrylli]